MELLRSSDDIDESKPKRAISCVGGRRSFPEVFGLQYFTLLLPTLSPITKMTFFWVPGMDDRQKATINKQICVSDPNNIFF
jgi:hypothetical protein